MPLRSTVYSKTVTATSDNAFQVEQSGSPEGETILTDVNIHCYTNDCYYGNAAVLQGIIRANAVVWFTGHVKVSDLFFKNYTAGSNCVIVVTGLVKQ
jgi:hypothetical protein